MPKIDTKFELEIAECLANETPTVSTHQMIDITHASEAELDALFAAAAAKQKLTADQFRDLCDEVAYWRDSLSSARDDEITAEAERLRSKLRELERAQLTRRNPELEQTRARVVDSARRTLSRRLPG